MQPAAWFSRANENKLTQDEIRATYPAKVSASLGLDSYIMLDSMLPLSELSAGLEQLVS